MRWTLTSETDTVRTQPGREDFGNKHPGNGTPACTVADHEEVDCNHVSYTVTLTSHCEKRDFGLSVCVHNKRHRRVEDKIVTYCEDVSILVLMPDFFRIPYLMATIAVLAWLTPLAPGTGG